MTKEERIYRLKQIEKDIYVCSLDATFEEMAKSCAIRSAIEELEERRWIPVTERLPEEGERVFATHLGGLNKDRQVIEHIYENGEFTCNWYMDMDITSPTFGKRFMGDVIAWMPLPKPYEEGATIKWNEYKLPSSTPNECGTYLVKFEDGSTGYDDCVYYGYSGTYQFDSLKVVAWADKEGAEE